MCSVQILNLMRFHCNTARREKKSSRPLLALLCSDHKTNEWGEPEDSLKGHRHGIILQSRRSVVLSHSSPLQSHSDDPKGTLKSKSLGFDPLTSPHFFFFLPRYQAGVVRSGDAGGQRLMGSCGKDMDGWVSWLGAVRTEKGWAAEKK